MVMIQVCDICHTELENPSQTFVDIAINKRRGNFPLPEMFRLTLCEDCF